MLGLDVGTTSTIGLLIRLPGEVLGIASRPVTLRSPEIGWAEEDPAQWWSNVCAITRELLATSGIAPRDLAAVGVTGMLPAVVLLDGDGNVLRPSIQQSDGRCGAEVLEIASEIAEADFLARAGNGINQQLVAAKLRWVHRHEPAVFGRIATVFGSYDYVNWRLTGERAVEQNWALEAGFTKLATGVIDDELIGLAGIARESIPQRTHSHQQLGFVTQAAASQTGLPVGLAVVGGAADHVASALAAGVVSRGDVLLKFGGSIDMLVATDNAVADPRMYLDYHLIPGLFMPNGCMSTGGSGLNWFAATFAGAEAVAAKSAHQTLHQYLDHLAEQVIPGAQGVWALPHFLGEKTPIHDPSLRGVFGGLNFAVGVPHLWRALLESYAYAVRHHMEVFNDMGHQTERYIASDGGAESRLWMQIISDVLQAPILRLDGHPGSSLGAAWTAAIGVGLTRDWGGISAFVRHRDRVEPDAGTAGVYAEGYRAYRTRQCLSASTNG